MNPQTEFTPIRLTNNSAESTDPRVVVDNSFLYVAWRDTRDGNPEIYWQKFDRSTGSAATSPIRVTNSGAASLDPSIGIDGSGNSYVVWQEGSLYGTIQGVKLDGNGVPVFSIKNLSSNLSLHPDIAVNSVGVNWVTYQRMANVSDQNVYVRKSDYSLNQICLTPTSGTIWGAEKMPVIATDGTNGWVVYYDLGDYFAEFLKLEVFGTTCSKLGQANQNQAYTHPAVGSSNGEVWASIEKSGNIFNIMGTNSVSRVNDNSGTASFPRVEADPNYGYFVWQDSRDGNQEVYLSTAINNQDFSDQRITNNPASSQHPDIATDPAEPGKFWIVWQDNRDGNWEIYMTISHPALPLVVFADDFTLQASPLWTPMEGSCNWQIANGAYQTSQSGMQLSCVQGVGDSAWRNYVFECDVRGNSGVDKIVRFREADSQTRYFINLRSDYQGQDQLILGRQANGVETILQTVNCSSQNGTWYHLKITCVDEHVTVSVDNNQVIAYDDFVSRIYSGGIGLVCFTGDAGVCDISFDNVLVTDPFPHIVIGEPSQDFAVGDHVSLSGHMLYRDGSPFVPTGGVVGVEDPISAFSTTAPVASDGSFSYATVYASTQSGMWMFIFTYNTGQGVVRQCYNVPVKRELPSDRLNSSRPVSVSTGSVDRPMRKTTEVFSGRNPLAPFATGAQALTDGARSMWSSLKSDMAAGWQRTVGSGVSRQMLQNAEMFAKKCNPNNPLNGNCANMTASYGYLFAQSVVASVFAKAEKGTDLVHSVAPNLLDECQHSEIVAALDAGEVILGLIGFSSGKVIDAVSAMAEAASVGSLLESVENSYEKCVPPSRNAANPYPYAAFTFDPGFGDILLMGILPKIPHAVVINGYSPIEITVTDPRGRSINKDTTNIPGAEYMEIDTDLDGDIEQVVIVPLDTVGDVQVSIQAAPGSQPTDTFSVIANYTYYQVPITIADSLPISEIPSLPILVSTFVNLPPSAVSLLTTADTTFAGFPCILGWTSAIDPNPGHIVSYRVVVARQSNFTDSVTVEVGRDTTYSFDGKLWHNKSSIDTTSYYWQVYAHDDWNASTASIDSRSFKVMYQRGDGDGDGSITIADVVFLIDYIFRGGPAPRPIAAGDVDCSGTINIADVVYLINYIFNHGPASCTGR